MKPTAIIFDRFGNPSQPFWLAWQKKLAEQNWPVSFFADSISNSTTDTQEVRVLKKAEGAVGRMQRKLMNKTLPVDERKGFSIDQEILKNGSQQFHFLNAQNFPKYRSWIPLEKSLFSFRGFDLLVRPEIDQKWNELVRSVLDKGRRFHFVSEAIKSKALEYGADQKKCFTIYRRVDPNFILKEEKVENRPVQLLSVGRLTWQKGFDLALLALSRVSKETMLWNYRIIGDGPEYAKLRILTRKLGIEERVSISKPLSATRLSEVMKNSDVLLHPAITDALPNVLLEAGAAKMAVLASNSDGIPEIIQNNVSGRLVTFFDLEELTSNLREILFDRELRIKMGQNLQNHVLERFGGNNELLKWKEFYS